MKALRTGLGKELMRKLFENAPLVCHDAAVVDKLRSARGLARLSARKFGNAFDIDVKLIPEKSRGRRVGARLKRFVQKCAEQRKRCRNASAELICPIHQMLEIGEIACAGIPLRVQSVNRSKDAPVFL